MKAQWLERASSDPLPPTAAVRVPHRKTMREAVDCLSAYIYRWNCCRSIHSSYGTFVVFVIHLIYLSSRPWINWQGHLAVDDVTSLTHCRPVALACSAVGLYSLYPSVSALIHVTSCTSISCLNECVLCHRIGSGERVSKFRFWLRKRTYRS